jgi:hypothetical protein
VTMTDLADLDGHYRIASAFDEFNIQYKKLDGTMSRAERNRSMEALKADPKCEVLLVSLRAGGVGLNLTCAQRVYLMVSLFLGYRFVLINQEIEACYLIGTVLEPGGREPSRRSSSSSRPNQAGKNDSIHHLGVGRTKHARGTSYLSLLYFSRSNLSHHFPFVFFFFLLDSKTENRTCKVSYLPNKLLYNSS